MKSLTKILLVGFAALFLAACSEEIRSTDWYIQNTAEQAIKTTDCNARPELSETQNCINAHKAELIIGQGTDAIKKYLADNNL